MASGDRLSVSDGGQNFAFVTGAEHQPASNRRAPLPNPALQSPELPRGEWHRRLALQPLEQRLGRRIGLLVEPPLNPRPDGFNWVLASAIASWPAGSLVMGRPHFTIAPHRRKT